MVTYGAGTYGTGTLNRIDAALLTAQAASVRKTALKVSVLDTRINRWDEWAGTALQPDALTTTGTYPASTSQSYKYYRLTMGMCILSNGNIIRVRVGDGTYTNWNVYVQTITDPTVASQWTSWTLLYTGTHYGVGVAPATASTYHVYSAKSDGIYKNNVKKQSITGVIKIDPVQGQMDAMFVTKLRTDTIDERRVLDHYYSPNIETTAFADDTLNYRWMRSEISALLLSDGKVARAQVAGFYINPRSTSLAESLTISIAPAYNSIEPSGPPVIVRGFAGQAGSNAITNLFLTKLADGFYYLFYSESRYDYDKTIAISLTQTVFWQRSVNLIHWSEPVAIGFSNMNPTGISVVESGGYVYLANNGSVYRRPNTSTSYDISDYVNELHLSQPKSNQAGSGSCSVANLAGVNDALLNLTDCEVKVEIGLRCADGVYRYAEFGRWWIDRIDKQVVGKVNRLKLTLYDLWRRLDNPLRDNYNNVGRIDWADWQNGKKNQLYNYYSRGGVFKAIKENTWRYVQVTDTKSGNAFLFTGWKGHNGTVGVRIRTKPTDTKKLGVIYRYVDSKNYYWAYADGDTLFLVRVRNGTSTTLATHAKVITGRYTISVEFKWGIHRVYINGVYEFGHNESVSGDKPGYAGVRGTGGNYNFYGFSFADWQPNINTNDLITTLLAMGDFHSPSVSGGEAPQLAIVWGPQADGNTPAKALLSLAEQFKFELAWRGGRIEVGQFKEKTIVNTYANEVLEFSRTEEVGRRINLAAVDGRDDSWIEIDGTDTRFRGRQIVAYFDVPDLTTDDAVRLRASEEIRKGVIGSAYQAKLPLQFDLWRMDGITITSNDGTPYDLKVEGIEIDISQNERPKQDMVLELSPLT